MPELNEIAESFDRIETEIKSFQERADAEIKANGKANEDTKSALDGLADRLLGLEQKMSRRITIGDTAAVKSIGDQVIESEGFQAFAAKSAEKAKINIKATITSATTDAAGSVGAAIQPHRLPGIVTPPDRTLTVRDIISTGTTTSNMVEYVKEKSFNNAAAPVAENPGTSKPVSDIQFELKDAPVRTIAHVFHVSRQAINDVPQLAAYINARGVYGLKYVEENQLLYGPGTGQNLLGIAPQAAAFKWSQYSGLVSGTPQMADMLRLAMLQVRQAEYHATAIMMNPADWAAIELLKTTGGSQEYVWANPRALAAPGLWGLPVIDTASVAPNQFMIGDFVRGATLWDRESATVELSEHHGTNFTENLVTVRIEERIALTVTRPSAFVRGSFGGSPSVNV